MAGSQLLPDRSIIVREAGEQEKKHHAEETKKTVITDLIKTQVQLLNVRNIRDNRNDSDSPVITNLIQYQILGLKSIYILECIICIRCKSNNAGREIVRAVTG